jgi:hypothetical protein
MDGFTAYLDDNELLAESWSAKANLSTNFPEG